jgi:hypothetical protein
LLKLSALAAPSTGHGIVHPIIATADGLMAELAVLGTRNTGVLGGAKLWRGITE